METNTHQDARTEANRRNAQFSTGPRTVEGKARSSQNARAAGWFARELRLEGDEAAEAFSAFLEAWRTELQPQGLVELEAFDDFVRAAWHRREIVAAQNEATASSPAAFLDDTLAKTLDRLHRYERDFERRAARHLATLRCLQSQRCPPEPPPQKQTQADAALTGLPAPVLQQLRILAIEASHWRAQLRAQRARLPHHSRSTISAMLSPTEP